MFDKHAVAHESTIPLRSNTQAVQAWPLALLKTTATSTEGKGKEREGKENKGKENKHQVSTAVHNSISYGVNPIKLDLIINNLEAVARTGQCLFVNVDIVMLMLMLCSGNVNILIMLMFSSEHEKKKQRVCIQSS